jgi:hypothetical protein
LILIISVFIFKVTTAQQVIKKNINLKAEGLFGKKESLNLSNFKYIVFKNDKSCLHCFEDISEKLLHFKDSILFLTIQKESNAYSNILLSKRIFKNASQYFVINLDEFNKAFKNQIREKDLLISPFLLLNHSNRTYFFAYKDIFIGDGMSDAFYNFNINRNR